MALPGETVATGGSAPEGEELQVLHSAAGYYLGFLEDGMPYSRETIYFATEEDAQSVLNRYVLLDEDNEDDEDELTNLVMAYWR